jgi:transposase
LKQEAERVMVVEARRHRIARVLETAPGIGPVRAAQIVPIVVTPYRFRTARQFWAYCGLGVVTRSSSAYLWDRGRWVRARVTQTRGLNFNHNRTLKQILKGAAMTIAAHASSHPLHAHYERLLQGETKPNLARLIRARKIAAIVLASEHEPGASAEACGGPRS